MVRNSRKNLVALPPVVPERSEVVMGRPDGAPLKFYTGLYGNGHAVAVTSGKTERDAETERAGVATATDAAKALGASSFDPKQNPSDRLTEEERQRLKSKLGVLEVQVQHAAVARRDAKQALASCGDEPKPPERPYLTGLLGTLGVAISIMFCLHDAVWAHLVEDMVDALLASAASGLLIAGLAVWSLLSSVRQKSSVVVHFFWITVCLGFGLTLLLLRFSAGTSQHDLYLAYGFAGVDLVSLLIIELVSHGLRLRWQAFEVAMARYAQALKVSEAASEYEDNRIAVRDALLAELKKIDDQIAKRESLVRSTPLVMAQAGSIWRLGYAAGIEENEAHLKRGGPKTWLSDSEVEERVKRLLGVTSEKVDEK